MSSKLDQLKARREALAHELERIDKFVSAFDVTSKSLNTLKTRLTGLSELKAEFKNIQLQIEQSDGDTVAEHANTRADFDDRYCEITAAIYDIMDGANETSVRQVNNVQPPKVPQINLPVLNLKTFDGEYKQWLSFENTFKSVIDENKSLSNCHRLQYLRSALTGEALKSIETLSISDENYLVAWQTIERRFKNTRLIVHDHIHSIINLAPITKSTPDALRELINVVTINIAALRSLKLPVESWDMIIITIVAEKLDYNSRREWQFSLDNELPTYAQFVKFLEKRCSVLESLSLGCNKVKTQGPNKFKTAAHAAVTNKTLLCVNCKESGQYVSNCPECLNLDVNAKITLCQTLKLCKNCLRNNHKTAGCKIQSRCRHCNKAHHTLLHVSNTAENNNAEMTANNVAHTPQNNAILPTARVLIKTARGELLPARAMLDSGSMANYIAEAMFKKLGLKARAVNFSIQCLNGTASKTTQEVDIVIKAKQTDFSKEMPCLIVKNISQNVPFATINRKDFETPKNICLADPQFNVTGCIDLLLGAGVFWELLCVGQIMTSSGLIFQKTQLGFIAGGNIKGQTHMARNVQTHFTAIVHDPSLEEQVKRFWELENVSEPINKQMIGWSQDENECETHFKKNVSRDENGRFVVRLPVRGAIQNIGDTPQLATKRYLALERKLVKNPGLKREYMKFMHEYRDLKHMEPLRGPCAATESVYLPHHAVLKADSTTTKLRVVFDASMKGKGGGSLNDNLLTGPVIQDDLCTILLRFREHRFVLNADIAKMYRQIKLHEDQTKYHLILWRDESNKPLETFKLKTLTYGTRPASFIATRCIKQLADENKHLCPQASEIISRDFYMDDLVTGSNSIDELIQMKMQIVNILNQAQFELRKFQSNDGRLLEGQAEFASNVDFDKTQHTKTLGLHWNPKTDTLKYEINRNLVHHKVTKRIILSITAQIFDPLGLLGPITMTAKIIIQQLWSCKLGWDESVPCHIHTTWLKFLRQLESLNKITIPRKVIPSVTDHSIQLHGFCDASQKGYGAAVYVRSKVVKPNSNTQLYQTRLLCSKSRVAPLKATTLPRLELCGAVLLARIINKIRKADEFNKARCVLWTDSTIVLAWISTSSHNLKTFVANRVSEITSLTTATNWRHVKGEHNAADILSRGAFPADLLISKSWFEGPDFLKHEEVTWPIPTVKPILEVPETRPTIAGVSTIEIEMPVLNKFSTYSKLQRVMGWTLRFIHNARGGEKLKGNLSYTELKAATVQIVKLIQKNTFQNELRQLEQQKDVQSSSKLALLNPFIDEHKTLRVGGRLRHAAIHSDIKHPMILPKGHPVTGLIIRSEHEKQMHAGAQATLASLQRNFWIVGARDKIRKIIHQCHRCFREKPVSVETQMGNLPESRTKPTRPFLVVGVDYAGPIMVRETRGRGKRPIKAYIALFVCFATKAVHIELTTDLTTEEFLAALRRFVGRRGVPQDIYSDNATNFVGANNELAKIRTFFKNSHNEIDNELAKIGVKWHFIPPRSPHMGGLWESNIKSIKRHLKCTMGNANLTLSEMYTVLIKIEACMNSRPLTPLSSDPNDLQVLTPGHFLIGEPLTAIPEQNTDGIAVNRLSRWQLVERIRCHFWRRWQKEYLVQLQGRTRKNAGRSHNIKMGSMVLLMEENLPPLMWKIGRIIGTHPGDDGVVRVATVRTQQGTVKRAVRKLCLLPLDQTNNGL